jgi:hypothetical protein
MKKKSHNTCSSISLKKRSVRDKDKNIYRMVLTGFDNHKINMLILQSIKY